MKNDPKYFLPVMFLGIVVLVITVLWQGTILPKTKKLVSLNENLKSIVNSTQWEKYLNQKFGYAVTNSQPPFYDQGEPAWAYSLQRKDFSIGARIDVPGDIEFALAPGTISVNVYGITKSPAKDNLGQSLYYPTLKSLISFQSKLSKIVIKEKYTNAKNIHYEIIEREPIDGMEDGYTLLAFTASDKWFYSITLVEPTREKLLNDKKMFINFLDNFYLSLNPS